MNKTINAHQKNPQLICLIIGILFLFYGSLRLILPHLLNVDFSPVVSILYISSGLISFLAGKMKDPIYSHYFCIAGFIFTGILCFLGFSLGYPGLPTLGFITQDPKYLILIPGIIELGTVDHYLNFLLMIAFLLGIFQAKRRLA